MRKLIIILAALVTFSCAETILEIGDYETPLGIWHNCSQKLYTPSFTYDTEYYFEVVCDEGHSEYNFNESAFKNRRILIVEKFYGYDEERCVSQRAFFWFEGEKHYYCIQGPTDNGCVINPKENKLRYSI